MSRRILYIEDNSTIRAEIAANLRRIGFFVKESAALADARQALLAEKFDLILLDLLLPDGNGLDFLRELRRAEGARVPVIILSALGEIDERVTGLDAGADDYLPKPFSTRELVARIHAALRAGGNGSDGGTVLHLKHGAWLDFRQPCVFLKSGEQIKLTAKEFFLLRHLAEHAEKIISREEILERVWQIDPEKMETASIAVYISRLRKKLDQLCEFETFRGSGYRLTLR